MKNKFKIAFLYSGYNLGEENELFFKLAEKKGIQLVMFNVSKRIDGDNFIEKVKLCDLVYNNTAEGEHVLEYAKTAEVLGKTVIDSPSEYYYTENKWMFYVKCKQNNIPVPDTILLSKNLASARKELKDFRRWPVVLKRVYGCMGEFVEKADNVEEAEKIIKYYWSKGSERIPIIAQEFIYSPSYRVVIIDKEYVQTAIKQSYGLKSWKSTGFYSKKFKRFEIDEELKHLLDRMMRFVNISVCGVDLCKKNDRWIVLEVNSNPTFYFFENEHKKLVNLTLDLLKKKCLELKR